MRTGIGGCLVLAATISVWLAPARATEVHDLDDDPEGHRAKTMYEVVRLGPDEALDPAAVRMDLDYIDMMSRHHAGAQAMSEDYLGDEQGANPVLRKLADAIIYNQGFEITVLARARESVAREPVVLDLGLARLAVRELGVDGLEHRPPKFIPKPAPTGRELALLPPERITAYDVAFAKGMMIHHQAAADMAWKYNQDPMARNRVLRLLNLGIIREQLYEIGFLGDVVARYPGDAAAVQPTMPLGMDMGGMHGGHGELPDPLAWRAPDLPLSPFLGALGIVPSAAGER